jgi:REP element-mobilizing transposase RayT
LPHIQPPGATFFLTFRLFGSIPASKLAQLQDEAQAMERRLAQIKLLPERQREAILAAKRQFAHWDALLDAAAIGPKWLAEAEVACIVADALHYQHGRTVDLDSYSILSNHVHVVLTPLEKPDGSYHSLARILHSVKSFSANKANLVIQRQGAFWQHESYDHYVRDPSELLRIRNYVLNNPVKAGLADSIENWPWSYSKYGFS